MSRTKIGEKRARATAEKAMATLGMSAAALAREAGVDPSTVGDFVAGRRWPRREKLAAMERVLMLSAGTLTSIAEGGEDEVLPRRRARVGRPDAEVGAGLAEEIRHRLHPGLRRFTDAELLREVEARALLYAAELTARDVPTLTWAMADDGGDEIVSGPPAVG